MQNNEEKSNFLWEEIFSSRPASNSNEIEFEKTFQEKIVPQLKLRNTSRQDAFNKIREDIEMIARLAPIHGTSKDEMAQVPSRRALKKLEELFIKNEVIDITDIYNTLNYIIVDRLGEKKIMVLDIVNDWNSDLIRDSLYKLIEVDATRMSTKPDHRYNVDTQRALQNEIIPGLRELQRATVSQNDYRKKDIDTLKFKINNLIYSPISDNREKELNNKQKQTIDAQFEEINKILFTKQTINATDLYTSIKIIAESVGLFKSNDPEKKANIFSMLIQNWKDQLAAELALGIAPPRLAALSEVTVPRPAAIPSAAGIVAPRPAGVVAAPPPSGAVAPPLAPLARRPPPRSASPLLVTPQNPSQGHENTSTPPCDQAEHLAAIRNSVTTLKQHDNVKEKNGNKLGKVV